MVGRIVCILGISVSVFGCSQMRFAMNPQVEAVLGDSIIHSIQNLEAATSWSPGFGHGLTIEVYARRDSSLYAKDWALESNGAGTILATLAESELGRKWAFIEVYYTIDYGRLPPRFKDVLGGVIVFVLRDTMILLGNQRAPVWAYPIHALYIRGYKEQPDSKQLLKWEDDLF